MAARLIDCLATTDELGKLFADASVLEAMLRFEVALARVQARLGILPQTAAEKIAAAAKPEFFDTEAISRDSLRVGTPIIPLVKALRERVHAADSSAASFVHWGATSQDAADTALILLLKKAHPIFESNLSRVEKSLHGLAEKHANTVMLGRTLMQPAPPVTFGLKAAGWLGAIHRSHRRLNGSFTDALILQFGGASGTLAFLGDEGIAVGKALADELGLAYPEAPWHTQRDRLATLMCACGVLTVTLGKMARDISLLMQHEVHEVAEGVDSGRGGSSTMPHKHNPVGCVLTLAAANRVPGLVAAFLSEMIQEYERGIGGWQAEWPTVAAIIQATGLAIDSMAEVAEGLTVDSARMRSNIDATHGTVFAEKALMILAPHLGRDAAHKLLESATAEAVAQGRRLSEVLAEKPEIKRHLDSKTLGDLENPELYLGVAEDFRTRLLSSVMRELRGEKE
jgi:3-carboxy-cis,cis-muconate cycloisomerase